MVYKVGTQSSVLIKQGVLIFESSFKRGSTVLPVLVGFDVTNFIPNRNFVSVLLINELPLFTKFVGVELPSCGFRHLSFPDPR